MTGTIIPLRLKRDETSALASFDTLATELLAEGRAPNLSVARFDTILKKLRGQRAKLASVLDYSRALSALIDPVSPVPAMSWQGVRRRLMRNWRAEAVARKRGLNCADAEAAKAA